MPSSYLNRCALLGRRVGTGDERNKIYYSIVTLSTQKRASSPERMEREHKTTRLNDIRLSINRSSNAPRRASTGPSTPRKGMLGSKIPQVPIPDPGEARRGTEGMCVHGHEVPQLYTIHYLVLFEPFNKPHARDCADATRLFGSSKHPTGI